jgi:hypothetical protein
VIKTADLQTLQLQLSRARIRRHLNPQFAVGMTPLLNPPSTAAGTVRPEERA